MKESWIANNIVAEYNKQQRYKNKMLRQNCKSKKCTECINFNKCYGNGSDNNESSN